MDEKLFLIAIGGTGMRCLESFVHMCAAGLFDNHTIDILTLDTDQTNGNKDTKIQNLWHTAKGVLRGKFIENQSDLRKQEKAQ